MSSTTSTILPEHRMVIIEVVHTRLVCYNTWHFYYRLLWALCDMEIVGIKGDEGQGTELGVA
eukprot:11291736-Ditylum_brightwellii.AAC.1